MNNKSHTPQRLLSLLLLCCMLLGIAPTAYAHAEDEGSSGTDHDETPYSITIYNEKTPNKNGSLTYTVTCHEHGDVSEVYDLEDTGITALAGDTVTLYPAANEGFVLSSIGYVRTDRVEQAFNIKSVTDNKDGSYSFTMPANNIYIGAAFYAEDDYYVLKEAGTGNTVANVDPLQVIELGLNQAWLHENAEEVSVDMHLDKRILTFDETSGRQLTFRMEIREVGDSGFVLKGAQEYTVAELQALVEAKSAGIKTDDKGREIYILRDVTIPVDADQDFTYTANGEYEVYCTAMFTLDGWTNAVGAPFYRWGYSGGDRAFIMENGTTTPTSMVYLYNLEPETYHGALVADAIRQVGEEFGMTIKTRYFTPENMTERIGYLAEWPGYDSYGDTEPSEKTYKKKIVLYCSLPSMVRDRLGDVIRETGVTNLLSSKLTAYGASKSFEEFYKLQETESEVFTAALALSLLTYETSTVVTEEAYGDHELWPEFKAAFDEAKAIINMTGEQELSVYNNARLKLQDVYLRILGKTLLDAQFAFLIEDHDEQNYKITIDPATWPEGLEATYRWYDASREDHLIIAKNELYKVNCTISATDDNMYYGFKQISLAAPGELSYKLAAGSVAISVDFDAYASKVNTPEPITYTAELYQNGELIALRSNKTGSLIVFSDLESETEYSIRLYASNIVGRTTYVTETVTTKAPSSSSESSSGSTNRPAPEAPETEEEAAFPFTDVAANAWYRENVAYVYENGLMGGTSETLFAPSGDMTRAMLMTVLARLDGVDTEGGSTWYEKGLSWAVAKGISDGTMPAASITREQLATMLWRYAGSPASTTDLSAFADASAVSSWAQNAMCWAVENGILQGDNGSLLPAGNALRSHVAAMLQRFCAIAHN